MRRRDLSKTLLASAAGAALFARPAQAQTCSAPCYPQTASETAAPVNPQYEPGDVRRYGASTSGTAANNRAAIQAAIDANSLVRIPETYPIDAVLYLHSNLTIVFDGTGGLTLASGVTTQSMLRGNAVDNIKIMGGRINGNGLAGYSNILLISCTSVLIDGSQIAKAGAQAVQLEACSNCTVRNSDLSNNYYYGIFDRDGVGNRYEGNRFFGNGNTGVAISTGGRGVNLWRCVGCFVGSSRFVGNNEYGFRIYSEAADTSASYGNIVEGCYFQDNERADIVLYDESLTGSMVKQNVISNCVIERSTNPGLDVSVLLHGGDNTVENVHVHKNGTFGNFVAFYFYYAVRNKVVNSSASYLRDFAVFSNVTDCVVDNCTGNSVATVGGIAGIVGIGQVIRGSRFKHGGVGTSDVAIVNYNATGRNFIEDNRIDGFSVGIYIGSEAVTLRNNNTTGSGSAGLRKDNNAQVGQEITGNVWDSANPVLIQHLERRTAGTAVLYASSAPSIRTWALGDRCLNSAPAAGQPKSWICTAAGTPGTWLSEGTL